MTKNIITNIVTFNEIMLTCLDERHQIVIKMRYGIDYFKKHTLKEIGETLGVTPERIRQMQYKALFKIKKYQWENDVSQKQ